MRATPNDGAGLAARLRGARLRGDGASFERQAEMRFRRQTQSLPVPVPPQLDAAGVDGLVERFEAAYERRFGAGSAYREAGVELVTCHVRATVARPRPGLLPPPGSEQVPRPGGRPVYDTEAGAFLPTAVYDGTALVPGRRLAGPAVVQHPGMTVLVASGWAGTVDAQRNLWLERQ